MEESHQFNIKLTWNIYNISKICLKRSILRAFLNYIDFFLSDTYSSACTAVSCLYTDVDLNKGMFIFFTVLVTSPDSRYSGIGVKLK